MADGPHLLYIHIPIERREIKKRIHLQKQQNLVAGDAKIVFIPFLWKWNEKRVKL